MRTDIAILNLSKRVDLSTLKRIARALRYQIRNDYAPAWGRRASDVEIVTREEDAGDAHVITLFDKADDTGSFGWHTESPLGKEYSRIFVELIMKYASGSLTDGPDSVSAVVSHEALEYLEDPFCMSWEVGPPIREGHLYAREICDPVQGSSYAVNRLGAWGVHMSNFIRPEWFDNDLAQQYDHLSTLHAGFIVGPGGYMVVSDGSRESNLFGRRVFHPQLPALWRSGTVRHPAARSRRRENHNPRMRLIGR